MYTVLSLSLSLYIQIYVFTIMCTICNSNDMTKSWPLTQLISHQPGDGFLPTSPVEKSARKRSTNQIQIWIKP